VSTYTAIPKEFKGRFVDRRRRAYMKRFGIKCRRPWRDLPDDLLLQLDRCADDEARRILLGITEREA